MKRLIITAALALAATTAIAADLPDYDVDGYCKGLYEENGVLDQRMYNYCIQTEQEAYDSLKANWEILDANAVASCTDLYDNPNDPYRMLKYCIEQQTAAAAAVPTFKK